MRRHRAGCRVAPLLVLARSGFDEGFRVSVDGDVSLIFAGWLPQDGAFGSERHACLESSVVAGQGGCS